MGLSTSVCGTGSFSAHTATHSTSGSAYETQSFSTELRKTKKCQRTLDTNKPKKSNWHFPLHLIIYHLFAGVAELADAQASGACGSNIVWVQVPSPAFHTKLLILMGQQFFYFNMWNVCGTYCEPCFFMVEYKNIGVKSLCPLCITNLWRLKENE